MTYQKVKYKQYSWELSPKEIRLLYRWYSIYKYRLRLKEFWITRSDGQKQDVKLYAFGITIVAIGELLEWLNVI